MEQRALGQTGPTVSALGFGCGSVGGLMVRGEPEEQQRAVARALDAGITYFDTAALYGNGRSEENLGRALSALDAWPRVVVGTKVRLATEDRRNASAALERSLQQSLRLLGRESVDLLQLHNHVGPNGGDSGLPADELLGAVAEGLRRVVAAGLARHVGLTGLGDADVLRDATRSGRFETVQAYFNALNPSAGFVGATSGAHDFAGLINDAASAGMGVIAIRVLAAGALTGSDVRAPNASAVPASSLVPGSEFERDISRAHRLAALVGELGLESGVELGVRFALAKTGVSTVLVGYSDLRQLEDAIRWAERGPLPADAVQRVVEAARTAS